MTDKTDDDKILSLSELKAKTTETESAVREFFATRFALADAVAMTKAFLSVKLNDTPHNAEIRLTRIFERYAKDRFVFNRTRMAWMRLDEFGLWVEDTESAVQVARDFAEGMVSFTADAKQRRSISRQVEHGHIFRAALENARHSKGLFLDEQHFDCDPLLVGVKSGVFDIKAGELRKAMPSELVSMRIDFDPDFADDCPHFEEVMRHASDLDGEVEKWLWRFFGYCTTAETREEVLLFLCGRPKTGKTTLGEAILDALDCYGSAVESDHFVKTNSSVIPHSQWLHALREKRTIFVSELPERASWDTSKLNRIVSGERLIARAMYRSDIEFRSKMKAVVFANHAPNFSAGDGIERRVRMLRMDRQPEKVDDKLRSKLRLERHAILARLLTEANLWHREGLPTEPEQIASATRAYRLEQDSVESFWRERMESDMTAPAVPIKTIHEAYVSWLDENEVSKSKRVGIRKFRERLELEHPNCIEIGRGRTKMLTGWRYIDDD